MYIIRVYTVYTNAKHYMILIVLWYYCTGIYFHHTCQLSMPLSTSHLAWLSSLLQKPRRATMMHLIVFHQYFELPEFPTRNTSCLPALLRSFPPFPTPDFQRESRCSDWFVLLWLWWYQCSCHPGKAKRWKASSFWWSKKMIRKKD